MRLIELFFFSPVHIYSKRTYSRRESCWYMGWYGSFVDISGLATDSSIFLSTLRIYILGVNAQTGSLSTGHSWWNNYPVKVSEVSLLLNWLYKMTIALTFEKSFREILSVRILWSHFEFSKGISCRLWVWFHMVEILKSHLAVRLTT